MAALGYYGAGAVIKIHLSIQDGSEYDARLEGGRRMKTIYKLPDGGKLDIRKASHREFIDSLKRELRSEQQELSSIMNSSPSASPAFGGYKFAVDRTRSVEQVEGIINSRTSQGWEFVTAYAAIGGVGANFATNVLIFRRKV